MAETRRRNVHPAVAHERAAKAALSRTGADYHLRKLAAATLTDEQKRRLADLLAEAGRPPRVTGADYHLRKLAAATLTEPQKRKLAALLLPFLGEPAERGAA